MSLNRKSPQVLRVEERALAIAPISLRGWRTIGSRYPNGIQVQPPMVFINGSASTKRRGIILHLPLEYHSTWLYSVGIDYHLQT